MSFARRQERVLAMKAASAPAPGSGHTRTAAAATSAAADQEAFVPAGVTPVARVAATINARLRHDLQTLKATKSIERKIAAKRLMLPEYQSWCDGLIDAARQIDGRELAPTGADDVLPTIMVWSIDTADWTRALTLAAFVLRYNITMPKRYERDAATLVVEEIAEAAGSVQGRGEAFPLYVLEAVEELTLDIDMHDQPRAKLLKAIGTEYARVAGQAEGDAAPRAVDRAIDALTRAQGLHDRVGVKTLLRGLEKTRAAITKLTGGDLQPPTGVGGSEARPAETSTQPPAGDHDAAKAGTDATTPQE